MEPESHAGEIREATRRNTFPPGEDLNSVEVATFGGLLMTPLLRSSSVGNWQAAQEVLCSRPFYMRRESVAIALSSQLRHVLTMMFLGGAQNACLVSENDYLAQDMGPP